MSVIHEGWVIEFAYLPMTTSVTVRSQNYDGPDVTPFIYMFVYVKDK